MTSEKKLLLGLYRSEEEAYKEIFARYYGKVYRFIRAILHGGAAVEDLTQNVFLKIWYNRHKLPEVIFKWREFIVEAGLDCPGKGLWGRGLRL